VRVVIDGLPIQGQSLAIVVQHLLEGWEQLGTDDELHLVTGPDAELEAPKSVTVHPANAGGGNFVGRLRDQSFEVPRICREVKADVMLGVLPTTVITRLPCPRALIAYDLRHELRKEQFSRGQRLKRRIFYDLGFFQADAILCISERTRQDMLAARPWLAKREMRVAHLGGDHTADWPARVPGEPYALAFGQYGNKNVDLVVDAWALLMQRGYTGKLAIVGLNDASRAAVQERVDRLGLTGLVLPQPWLADEQFRERFASASLVVFPSDFEGFGMPAVEAMQLGIPLVITPERALLEVTDGHATVMDGWDAAALADAVPRAFAADPAALAAATEHGRTFTWAGTAASTREALRAVCNLGRPAEPSRSKQGRHAS
jgi:glycosyltransferase involved in cell wall biosynthesis